ncbi:hypothetical protein C1N72_10920 [Pantoea ananatis]|nr:hypothetical protein [Pantoea ananatis]
MVQPHNWHERIIFTRYGNINADHTSLQVQAEALSVASQKRTALMRIIPSQPAAFGAWRAASETAGVVKGKALMRTVRPAGKH